MVAVITLVTDVIGATDFLVTIVSYVTMCTDVTLTNIGTFITSASVPSLLWLGKRARSVSFYRIYILYIL